MPSWPIILAWGLPWALASLAAIWLLSALFRDRSQGRLRCPRCWYDMAGAGLTCPECGKQARSERALRRTRRRKGQACAAFLLVLMAYPLHVTIRAQQIGWPKALPTWALLRIASLKATSISDMGHWEYELLQRARNSETQKRRILTYLFESRRDDICQITIDPSWTRGRTHRVEVAVRPPMSAFVHLSLLHGGEHQPTYGTRSEWRIVCFDGSPVGVSSGTIDLIVSLDRAGQDIIWRGKIGSYQIVEPPY